MERTTGIAYIKYQLILCYFVFGRYQDVEYGVVKLNEKMSLPLRQI